MSKQKVEPLPVAPSGYKPRQWAALVGLSVSTIYHLAGELAPRSVRVGARVIITEQPGEYLKRIEALQHREAA
jgi:hypothetical protein